jgi:predicted HTH domain antitoxin
LQRNQDMPAITDDILTITKMTATQLKEELAVFLYAKNKLSFGQARKLAGMDVLQFQELLYNNQVSLHYGITDLEEDIKAIHSYTE